ncbi:MAG TPA: B-box zinc finger protein [Candidatus Acidoferrum sp.]|nr:B-box zinc finger protein [Candidatus Acidoferrum sp.]
MSVLVCTKCFTPLSSSVVNLAEPIPCPGCQSPLRAEVFPAFFRDTQRGSAGELALQEGQATCFYHPQKTAHVPCDACGRFICALCDVELHGEHLCPSCVEAGRRKGKIVTLESKRTLHDSIALSLAILPYLAWPITIATAPATIIYSIVAWKKPGSLAGRSKVRFIIAIIIAALTIIGWGVGAYFLISSFQRTHR